MDWAPEKREKNDEFLQALKTALGAKEEKPVVEMLGAGHYLSILKSALLEIFGQECIIEEVRRDDNYLVRLTILSPERQLICEIDGGGSVLCATDRWVTEKIRFISFQDYDLVLRAAIHVNNVMGCFTEIIKNF